MKRALLIAATLCAASVALAQTIDVYSEFRRVDPFGKIIDADSAGEPREILSPMVARNGHAGFHLVVTPPKDDWATVYVGQNPDNAVSVKLYRETFIKQGDSWVPSQLVEVKLPFQGRLPDSAEVPGQTVFVLYLDIWVAPNAPVRRIKLEPQLAYGDRWIIYPMEVRVMAPIVPPAGVGKPLDLLMPNRRSDWGAMARLRQFVCQGGGVAADAAAPNTLAYMLDRNAQQDMALARALGDREPRVMLIGDILGYANHTSSRTWCEARWQPPSVDWYLRVRDAILRANR